MSSTAIIPNIKKGKLTEQIFDHLKELIISGQWAAGYHIPSEDELANLFGVSRMSVRSALQRLESIGLIDIHVGHGSIVKEFSLSDYISQIGDILLRDSTVPEIVQFRCAYEMEAIRLAIKRGSDEQMTLLHGYFDDIVVSLQQKKYYSFLECMYNFYHYICVISGNNLFVRLDDALKANLLSSSKVSGEDMENCEETMNYVYSLLCAIEARDVDKATAIFNDKVNSYLDNRLGMPSGD